SSAARRITSTCGLPAVAACPFTIGVSATVVAVPAVLAVTVPSVLGAGSTSPSLSTEPSTWRQTSPEDEEAVGAQITSTSNESQSAGGSTTTATASCVSASSSQ